MEGRIRVLPGARTAPPAVAQDITRDPTDLSAPLRGRLPQVVRIDLATVELKGQLADKTSYDFWTFNGKVPGPFVRVRVGDTVEVHMKTIRRASCSTRSIFMARSVLAAERSSPRLRRAKRRS